MVALSDSPARICSRLLLNNSGGSRHTTELATGDLKVIVLPRGISSNQVGQHPNWLMVTVRNRWKPLDRATLESFQIQAHNMQSYEGCSCLNVYYEKYVVPELPKIIFSCKTGQRPKLFSPGSFILFTVLLLGFPYRLIVRSFLKTHTVYSIKVLSINDYSEDIARQLEQHMPVVKPSTFRL